jgi:hypothetical protein
MILYIKYYKYIISLFLFFLFFNATSKRCIATSYKHNIDSTFIKDEKRISQLVKELIQIRFDDKRVDTLSKIVLKEFKTVLQKKGSFYYPFDSIFPVGKIVSKDKLVRIFTWYSVNTAGEFTYYGFIQYYSKIKKRVLLYELNDKSSTIEEPVINKSLTDNNWYGCTYYEIVQSKSNYGELYVLMGWDGNNIYTNKKIIESLVFTESGRPKFGKPVFAFGRKKVKRIIFEYSRMASMMIRYDENMKMIVMDHLSPSKSIFAGNPQYYGPDLSYDGLKFNNGIWEYIPAIDYKPVVKKKFLNKRQR